MESSEAEEDLTPLYRGIGDHLKEKYRWTCFILALAHCSGTSASSLTEHPVHNGPLHCRLSGYQTMESVHT